MLGHLREGRCQLGSAPITSVTVKIKISTLNVSFQCVNTTTCTSLKYSIILYVDHHLSCADFIISSKYSSSLVRYHPVIQLGMNQRYWMLGIVAKQEGKMLIWSAQILGHVKVDIMPLYWTKARGHGRLRVTLALLGKMCIRHYGKIDS